MASIGAFKNAEWTRDYAVDAGYLSLYPHLNTRVVNTAVLVPSRVLVDLDEHDNVIGIEVLL